MHANGKPEDRVCNAAVSIGNVTKPMIEGGT
jgi:hypothetical protein